MKRKNKNKNYGFILIDAEEGTVLFPKLFTSYTQAEMFLLNAEIELHSNAHIIMTTKRGLSQRLKLDKS